MHQKFTSLKLMMGLLSIILLFHFLIISEIISYEIVWAGKLDSVEEMRVFESISIGMNILFLTVFYIKYKNFQKGVTNKVVNFFIWAIMIFFAFNSIGNLFAKSKIELILGTSLTLLFAVLCWIILRKDKSDIPLE